jgi:D-psicose/D-tagatose/L-ribulose 3-epimerase
MTLCISNIAWHQEQEDAFLAVLPEMCCNLLEVAPSKIWPEPVAAAPSELRAYRAHVESFGLRIVSIQALLYSRPDLKLFVSQGGDRAAARYLVGLCRVAEDLGAEVMILGSPKNRCKGELTPRQAAERAAEIFAPVATAAAESGTRLCIEPLGPSETDFITTAREGAELVQLMDHPGFGLHLDAKALAEESGDLDEILRLAVPLTHHFHISEPHLGIPGASGLVDHARLGRLLAQHCYTKATSVEMTRQGDPHQAVATALARAAQWYGDLPGA